jgi:hypothetical protein
MNENVRRRPVSVGMVSLFAVLIILCLMIFAVLARLSAGSELSLAEKAAESVTAYYDAEYRAIIRLATESAASGTFTEEIDQNRELRVTFRITGTGKVIDEWAVEIKGTGEREEAPSFSAPPIF